MVSRSQHIAASATDARHRPGAACFIAAALAARIAATVVGPVALVMWNMRKIHFSHNWKTAAARTAVKGDRRESRSERSPLTHTAAEATRAQRARDTGSSLDPLLSTGLRRSNLGYSAATAHRPFRLLATLSSTCLPA